MEILGEDLETWRDGGKIGEEVETNGEKIGDTGEKIRRKKTEILGDDLETWRDGGKIGEENGVNGEKIGDTGEKLRRKKCGGVERNFISGRRKLDLCPHLLLLISGDNCRGTEILGDDLETWRDGGKIGEENGANGETIGGEIVEIQRKKCGGAERNFAIDHKKSNLCPYLLLLISGDNCRRTEILGDDLETWRDGGKIGEENGVNGKKIGDTGEKLRRKKCGGAERNFVSRRRKLDLCPHILLLIAGEWRYLEMIWRHGKMEEKLEKK
ncbi:hypothetical protein Pcinc_039960 [Petrolisthes cinctipes]|uniref:Uncharacterized protein n=1 Tax=Petrolisthes cinctipes TaxID=88211 RepID=A0AAE1BMJ6_PETCI|nr:hypothetical protein Pcinc_039960 [Petrolisthes cinctipes]